MFAAQSVCIDLNIRCVIMRYVHSGRQDAKADTPAYRINVWVYLRCSCIS